MLPHALCLVKGRMGASSAGTLRAVHLCRFELLEDASVPRSGIYHEGKFYETDGEKAVGIHEARSVRLLAPVGPPTLCRLMTPDGEGGLTYSVADPFAVAASGQPLDAGAHVEGLGIEARGALVAAGSEPGEPATVLGFTLVVSLVRPGELAEARRRGLPEAPARSLGAWYGPFVVTPDALEEAGCPDGRGLRATVRAGTAEAECDLFAGMSATELMQAAEAAAGMRSGEVVAAPAEPELLAGAVVPGERIRVEAGPLGILVCPVA
jgi:hypothetical protein